MWVGSLGLLPQPKDMHGVRLIAVGVNVNLNWFLSLYATQTDWRRAEGALASRLKTIGIGSSPPVMLKR